MVNGEGMRRKKYLSLYYEWTAKGEIPYVEAKRTEGGLCSIFPGNKKFNKLQPDEYDNCGYWGYGKIITRSTSDYDIARKFTPLRQNIVLFMAAMNGELD